RILQYPGTRSAPGGDAPAEPGAVRVHGWGCWDDGPCATWVAESLGNTGAEVDEETIVICPRHSQLARGRTSWVFWPRAREEHGGQRRGQSQGASVGSVRAVTCASRCA